MSQVWAKSNFLPQIRWIVLYIFPSDQIDHDQICQTFSYHFCRRRTRTTLYIHICHKQEPKRSQHVIASHTRHKSKLQSHAASSKRSLDNAAVIQCWRAKHTAHQIYLNRRGLNQSSAIGCCKSCNQKSNSRIYNWEPRCFFFFLGVVTDRFLLGRPSQPCACHGACGAYQKISDLLCDHMASTHSLFLFLCLSLVVVIVRVCVFLDHYGIICILNAGCSCTWLPLKESFVASQIFSYFWLPGSHG